MFAEERNRFLMTTGGGNQAHEPKDKKANPCRHQGQPPDNRNKGQNESSDTHDQGGDNQTQGLPQMKRTQSGFLAAMHHERDDESDYGQITEDRDGAIFGDEGG